MKQFILISLFAFTILLGCTKNKEYCWKCVTIKSHSNGTEEREEKTVCDKTKDEIRSYEEKQTYTIPTGPSTSVHYLTRCSIQ